jgi:uncharacterized protein (TIGR02453 family)
MAGKGRTYFTPKTLRFLCALARHNERDWFLAHKAEYEEFVRAPALALVADLAAPLGRVSPMLVADPRPVGGSLFRIHRDVRFSKDKRPYKTYAGMSFYHRATRASPRAEEGGAEPGRLDAPGLYLHVEPGATFLGGGLWHPQPATLRRIRDFMVDNPESWKKATRRKAFAAVFALTGDTLARPPRGYRPDHPLIGDLKRKDFVASSRLTDEELLSADLLGLLAKRYLLMAPLLEWLCLSLELEF